MLRGAEILLYEWWVPKEDLWFLLNVAQPPVLFPYSRVKERIGLDLGYRIQSLKL
jgi:hypothetical protein